MRLLLVGFPESIHLVRWIETIAPAGWDIHLFPSKEWLRGIHREMRGVTLHHVWNRPLLGPHPSVAVRQPSLFLEGPTRSAGTRTTAPLRLERATLLAQTIREIRPDIVHSHEMQHGAYVTLEARARLNAPFPTWIVSCWGSDLSYFGRDPEEAERIRAVLAACDYFACDCHRDISLARGFGFAGPVLPVLPIPGGFDLERVLRLRAGGPTSARRSIALKGHQHWAGRALIGLQALERCRDLLGGYRLEVYTAWPEVQAAAERFCTASDIELAVVSGPDGSAPYDDILRMHGRARVSIGLSTSDGISVAFLEAMTMGAFPIQSDTGCANEWADDGEGTLFVGAEDVDGVAAAIRRALTDDALVDRGAEINAGVVEQRLEQQRISRQAIATYERVATESRARRTPAVVRPDPGWVHSRAQSTGPVGRDMATRHEAGAGPPVVDTTDDVPELPRVTVITPAYNRATFLDETIRSVLDQDYPNLEYIVLDDGSTDDTLAVIQRYADALRWATHPNMGEGGTVNRGFSMATGEIIGVLSSDDRLLPGAIRAIVEAMTERPDVLVVYPDWEIIDEHGDVLQRVVTADYCYLDMLRWHDVPPGPGTFFRRSVVERVGGRDPSMRYVGDYDFWLQAGLLGPFRRLPRTLAQWRRHEGAITVAERQEAMAKEHILVMDKLYARSDLPSEVLDVKAEAYRNAFYIAALASGGDPFARRERFHVRDRMSLLHSGDADDSPESATAGVQAETVGQDRALVQLHEEVVRRVKEVATLHTEVAKWHGEVVWLHGEVAERDRTVAWLHEEVAERDKTVTWLHEEVAKRDEAITWLHGEVTSRDGDPGSLPEVRDGHGAEDEHGTDGDRRRGPTD